MSDLAERLSDLQVLNSQPLSPAEWSEEALKERYLELLAEGVLPDLAARELEHTGRWFRRFRSEKSERYDYDFSLRYDEIMHPDGEHREAIVQSARAALVKSAHEGNVRAIEKILMAYDPDFNFLRPASAAGDTYNVDKLIQIMPGIPTHLLEQMRAELMKQKELPVIDA